MWARKTAGLHQLHAAHKVRVNPHRLASWETVTVLLMESGWGWATNESGQSGWVPLEHLAFLT